MYGFWFVVVIMILWQKNVYLWADTGRGEREEGRKGGKERERESEGKECLLPPPHPHSHLEKGPWKRKAKKVPVPSTRAICLFSLKDP